MLSEDRVRGIFQESGAILEGHFLLASGRHSGVYVEKFRVLERPALVRLLAEELARRFVGEKPEAVVGPAVGGIILSFEVAAHLGVRSVFTERVGGRMVLRRGFQLRGKERVLVVEDVVTTGGSVKEVLDVVKEVGAICVGVGILVDRSESDLSLGVRTESLLRLPLASYLLETCPLCSKGIPLEAPGSRKLL